MQYVLCDVWCVMCDVPGLFFVRSWFFKSRGDQKYPVLVVSGLLSDIPKFTPDGSHMYTLSYKASLSMGLQIEASSFIYTTKKTTWLTMT